MRTFPLVTFVFGVFIGIVFCAAMEMTTLKPMILSVHGHAVCGR